MEIVVGDWVAIIGLCVTLMVHMVVTIWWAARLTTRMEHVERWVEQNNQIGTTLAAMQATITALNIELRNVHDTMSNLDKRLDGMSDRITALAGSRNAPV